MRERHFDKARGLLQSAVSEEEDSWTAHINLGAVYFWQGDPPRRDWSSKPLRHSTPATRLVTPIWPPAISEKANRTPRQCSPERRCKSIRKSRSQSVSRRLNTASGEGRLQNLAHLRGSSTAL